MAQTRSFRVLLLRHGLTDDNLNGVAQGQRQVPLNETGRQQACQLAGRLADERLTADVLVSSDLSRAAETAQIIAPAINAPIVYDPQWRERALGELEGRVVGVEGIWLAAIGQHTPPGAESLSQFVHRIRASLCGLGTQHPAAATIVVVAHGGPLRSILQMLHDGVLLLAAGQSPPEVVNIINCSVMELECQVRGQSQRWRLLRLNDAGHLGTATPESATPDRQPDTQNIETRYRATVLNKWSNPCGALTADGCGSKHDRYFSLFFYADANRFKMGLHAAADGCQIV